MVIHTHNTHLDNFLCCSFLSWLPAHCTACLLVLAGDCHTSYKRSLSHHFHKSCCTGSTSSISPSCHEQLTEIIYDDLSMLIHTHLDNFLCCSFLSWLPAHCTACLLVLAGDCHSFYKCSLNYHFHSSCCTGSRIAMSPSCHGQLTEVIFDDLNMLISPHFICRELFRVKLGIQ